MALVAAKCTECGESIEVDDEKDAGICNFCGTAFVTQKVINNTNISKTYNVEQMVVQGGTTVENLLIRTRQAKDEFDLIKAAEFACRALDLDPLNEEAIELSKIKGKIGGKEFSVEQLKRINELVFGTQQFAAHQMLGPLLGRDWTSTAVMNIIARWKQQGLPQVLQDFGEEDKLAKGCYIATSAYGSYNCPEVWVLRRYRDQKLQKTYFGRLFIKIYYAVSPALIKIFGKSKRFNSINRRWLDKKVSKLKRKGFSDLKYND